MKQRNQTFQYLEAMAILMVIDDHMSTRIGILSSIFPYNSFYMPLFVFISGYFYREQDIMPNIKHKIKHLMIPYILWSFAGDFIAFILLKAGIVKWYKNPFSIKSIISLLIYEPFSSATGAAWFVVMLFWVSVIYNILHHLLNLHSLKADYSFLIISILSGFVTLKLCMAGYNEKSIVILVALRAIWYMQFYHMGTMFRKYWEEYVKKADMLICCSVCVAVNVIFICIIGDIEFIATGGMGNFNSFWIPILTSVTGSMFWYKVMQLLSTKIGAVKIIDFLAENTFTIMCSHLLFVNIPNFYAYFQYQKGNPDYVDFPEAAFISSAWLRYNPNSRLIGFFCGLLGSLSVAFLINKIKSFYLIRYRKAENVKKIQ